MKHCYLLLAVEPVYVFILKWKKSLINSIKNFESQHEFVKTWKLLYTFKWKVMHPVTENMEIKNIENADFMFNFFSLISKNFMNF